MINKIVIGLGLVSLAWGQSGAVSGSIYQQLFVNTVAPIAVPIVTNVGQGSHIVQVIATAQPAKTCTSPIITAQLEFSFNKVLWTAFGTPIAIAVNQPSVNFYGNGVYPFVRFNVSGFDTTNCYLTAYYSGSVQPGLIAATGGYGLGTPVYLPQGSVVPPTVVGGYGTIGSSGLGAVVPLFVCDMTAFATVAAGATTILVPGNVGGLNIKVCGFVINAVAAGTAQFVTGTAANCSTNNSNISPVFHLATNGNLVYGGGLGNVMQTMPGLTNDIVGKGICLTAATGDMTVMLSYMEFQ